MNLVIELRGYIDERGNKRFADWLDGLNPIAAAKVTMALARLENGNHSNVAAPEVSTTGHRSSAELWADYKRRKKKETD